MLKKIKSLIYIDKYSVSEISELLSGYFSTASSVVFGTGGYKKYKVIKTNTEEITGGAYILISDQGAKWTVATDITGQELLYLYRLDDFWAISNSIYLLANKLREKKYKLTPNQSAINGFFVKSGNHFAAQPLSQKTIFDEVRLLDSSSTVEISKLTTILSVNHKTLFQALNFDQNISYEDTIAEYVNDAISEMKGLAEVDDLSLRCQLSGGYDSRAVFGVMTASVADVDRFTIESSQSATEDFSVAKQITDCFGFQINKPDGYRPSTIDTAQAYHLWKLGHVGSYLPIYLTRHMENHFSLKMKGDLWLSTKFFQNGPDRIEKVIKRSIPHDQAADVIDDFRGAIKRQAVSNDLLSLMLHYGSYRSRFHCGRRWYKNLGDRIIYTPLVSSKLGKAAIYSALNGFDAKQLPMDLLLAINPKLLDFNFDKASKNFSQSAVESSVFKKGITQSLNSKKVYFCEKDYSQEKQKKVGVKEDEFKEMLMDDFDKVYAILKNNELKSWKTKSNLFYEKIKSGKLSHDYRGIAAVLFMGFAYGVYE